MKLKMKFLSRKTIVTHSGKFHADDVFSVAAIRMIPGYESSKLIRTRDAKQFPLGDIVVDVGGVYDYKNNRFDHHQTEGAGTYDNGIPYCGFGLIWKHLGEQICGSKEVAEMVCRKLVQPIDAGDNGYQISTPKFNDVVDYSLDSLIDSFNPSWKEINLDEDKCFAKAVDFANTVLRREIIKCRDKISALKIAHDFYINSANKQIIVIDQYMPVMDEMTEHSEPLYVVHPHSAKNTWAAYAVRVNKNDIKVRKPFPKTWAGKTNDELVKVSGVADALFCHRALFLASAKSKEGAIKMAELAINNQD